MYAGGDWGVGGVVHLAVDSARLNPAKVFEPRHKRSSFEFLAQCELMVVPLRSMPFLGYGLRRSIGRNR